MHSGLRRVLAVLVGQWVRILAPVGLSKTLVALAFLLAVNATAAQDCSARILDGKTSLGFVGCISKQNVDAFLTRLNDRHAEVIIQSEGGAVAAAIEMAWAIRKLGVTVRIRGYCLSSCANYILPAAHSVILDPGASFMIHGDAEEGWSTLADKSNFNAEAQAAIAKIIEAEAEFYRLIPQAQLVHSLQKIRSLPSGTHIQFTAAGTSLTCIADGAPRWAPPSSMLVQFKLATLASKVSADWHAEFQRDRDDFLGKGGVLIPPGHCFQGDPN